MMSTTTDRTARSVVLAAYEEPLRLQEVRLPEPEPRGALVKVRAATLCGSDVHLVAGHYAGVMPVVLPLIPGHEAVAEVVRLGDGPRTDSLGRPLAEGDRVIWGAAPCRRCHTCVVLGAPNLCPNRSMGMLQSCAEFPWATGALGEYSYIAPTAPRLRVPDEVADHWASAASCAVRTAVRAVEAAGPIGPADHVVVQGSGPVGLFTTAAVAVHSPASLTVVGAPDARLDVARAWGATETVSVAATDEEERVARVREITEGRGADLLLECSGFDGVVSEGIRMAAIRGRYVLAGSVGPTTTAPPMNLVTTRELQVRGVFSADTPALAMALQFLARFRDRFIWDLGFGRRYALEDANAAMAGVRNGTELKPVLLPAG